MRARRSLLAPPSVVIKGRQSNYRRMEAAMSAISDQLRAVRPSLQDIGVQSAWLDHFGGQLLREFPRGTGPEAGVRTRARPAIWSNPRGFQRAGGRLLVAARGMRAAALRGDLVRVRAAFPLVRAACNGCHRDFRAPA
jgi:cytochrome c556